MKKMAGIMTSLSLRGLIFVYFPQGMECSDSPWMPESHGQNPHEATLGFPKLAQISQAPTEKHNFLTGGATPYPQLASESLCPLFGAGGLGSRWPLGWLLSLFPLSALLPSHSDPQPFTHSFPKGHYQTSLSVRPPALQSQGAPSQHHAI